MPVTGVEPRRLLEERSARADLRADPGDRRSTSWTNPLFPPRRYRTTEALDLGVAIFRSQLTNLIGLAALMYLPIQLLGFVLRFDDPDRSPASELATSGLPLVGIGSVNGLDMGIIGLQSIALSVLGICCGAAVSKMAENSEVRFLHLARIAVKRIWVSPVIVAFSWLVYALVGCVPIFGLVIAGSLTFVMSVVAGAEGLGPFAAIRRCIQLTYSDLRSSLVLFLAGIYLLTLIRVILMLGPLALMYVFGAPEPAFEIARRLTGLLLVIVQPLTACLAAGAYVHLRTGKEGWDLQWRIRRRGDGTDIGVQDAVRPPALSDAKVFVR